jgi:hypothetical protein
MVLHARCITLPNPKRGGLLNVKIKLIKSNQTCIHKHDNLGHCPYQKAQGGYSYKPPCHLNGIKPMSSRHTAWGLTTRADAFYLIIVYAYIQNKHIFTGSQTNLQKP